MRYRRCVYTYICEFRRGRNRENHGKSAQANFVGYLEGGWGEWNLERDEGEKAMMTYRNQ